MAWYNCWWSCDWKYLNKKNWIAQGEKTIRLFSTRKCRRCGEVEEIYKVSRNPYGGISKSWKSKGDDVDDDGIIGDEDE